MIEQIINAKHILQICNPNTFKDDFKVLIEKYHPDKWKDSRANDIMAKLNALKDEYVKGHQFTDDAGTYKSNGYIHTWTGDSIFRAKSGDNWRKLEQSLCKKYKDNALKHFYKYLPDVFTETKDESKCDTTSVRYIPLSRVNNLLVGVENKEKHVNWMFSRMVEICSILDSLNMNNLGINPDSVFIDPEYHSAKIMTFYHLTPYGNKIKTISGRWSTFYPGDVTSKKISRPGMDVTLAKKTAIYLLGDKSGSGVSLRANKNINGAVLEYLMTPEEDGRIAHEKWRKVLKDNFKSEFLILNI
jgi:hypothetical protein